LPLQFVLIRRIRTVLRTEFLVQFLHFPNEGRQSWLPRAQPSMAA
jgi:hypothetical protein